MILALLLPVAAAFDPSTVDAGTLARIAGSGQVVVVEEQGDGRVKLVTGGALVRAPRATVWDLITDYEAYPAWMPQTTSIVVTPVSDGVKDVAYTLDFEFSIITKTVAYTMRTTERAPDRVTWTSVAGELSSANGAWNLLEADGGKSTMAFYSTYTDLSSLGWIVRSLLSEQPSMDLAIQASTAAMVVKALKQRAETR